MKKRKGLFLILSLIMFIGGWQTVNADLPSNYDIHDLNGNIDATKLIKYIDKKRMEVSDTTFCVENEDEIKYYMTFEDFERDYPIKSGYTYTGKITKKNKSDIEAEKLSEIVKQVKEGTLEVMYEHNPKYYDNDVPVNSKADGKWHKVKTYFDTENNKNQLRVINLAAEDYLFFYPTDQWRGEVTINIRGMDDTGNSKYDRMSTGAAKFYVHKAPIALFEIIPAGTTVTLKDKDSYDIDYITQKPNNGIKHWYWSVEFNNSERENIPTVEHKTGNSVSVNLDGRIITNVRLQVEDYDGAFGSAELKLNDSLLKEPIVDFNYSVGEQYTTYVYQGTVEGAKKHETAKVKSQISWNDEGYMDWLYGAASRHSNFTATKTGDSLNAVQTSNFDNLSYTRDFWENNLDNPFSDSILNPKFSTIVNGNKINVRLDATNRYDMSDFVAKDLIIKNIDVVNKGGSSSKDIVFEDITIDNADFTYTSVDQLTPAFASYVGKKAFTVGNDMNYEFNLKTGDPDELKIKLKRGSKEVWLNKEGANYKGIIQKEDIPWGDSSTWGTLGYSIEVWSNRTNESLHNYTANTLIHTPVPISNQAINSSNENIEIVTDEVFTLTAESTKYAEIMEAKFPIEIEKVTGYDINGEPITTTIPANTRILLNKDTDNFTGQFILQNILTDELDMTIELFSTAFNGRDQGITYLDTKVISCKLFDFRVTMIRDPRVEWYYKDGDNYKEKPFFANKLPAMESNFTPNPTKLAKGYIFEYKIDSLNFNDVGDTVQLVPSFYVINADGTKGNTPVDLWWEDSSRNLHKINPLGSKNYEMTILDKSDRVITDPMNATWQGEYFIPATTIPVPVGTAKSQVESRKITGRDILIAFKIVGYKNNVLRFDYNVKQWGKERDNLSGIHTLFDIGDVILYDPEKNNLNDIKIRDNR